MATSSTEADNHDEIGQHVNGSQQQQQQQSQSQPTTNGDPPAAAQHHTSDLKDKLTHQKQKIKDKKNPPGGFDDTPLPDAPPGYTVKFTFHKASNLPAADIHTQASDPFLHATLTTDVPRRHKEDPLLTFRTRTERKTTNPEWKQEWVVANVPKTGFTLKCRIYDEDYPDGNDRLGNLTINIPHVNENWEGFGPEGKTFEVKKRSGSKRAYLIKAATSALNRHVSMTPTLQVGIDVLGPSDPPHALMCTVAPTYWFKHYSPMIGRLTGTKVNRDEESDTRGKHGDEDKQSKKYDFQANEIQLAGPVPPKLYHRYVEFRPIIGRMFASTGLRGKVLNMALHKQHNRVYNFDSSTEWGTFKPRSEEASLQFLKMAHFDEGGRLFTYVLSLDGLLRFTETGREFGIDLLSKHTMHSDVARYIACSGEFFIRRLAHPDASSDAEPDEPTHPDQNLPGGPPNDPPPPEPRLYQLVIDNDSGTYRPDKSVLPDLREFLQQNFPGLGVVTMDCGDEKLKKMKKRQMEIKKSEGKPMNMVLNRSPSSSSFSSDDESRLGALESGHDVDAPLKSKKERAWEALEDPNRLKNLKDFMGGGHEGNKDHSHDHAHSTASESADGQAGGSRAPAQRDAAEDVKAG
ncbi:hypothetical protein CONLIGDRAFT_217247 [Coniochaeta ligniaria NRRL 30616]|uniref:C2 domain-containing protein n=1 Tax=Coniochaeta ligniaria NRRL 30616 TaxID=1408157 RepID=A0A1J7I596_9PEZI|nr:hypothetical protein CONLIGDRAFT_217247 [Coniochaeta ligniaria NRRL 30616]